MTQEELREANRIACAMNYQLNKEKRLAYQRDYYRIHRDEISRKAQLRRMGLLPTRPRKGRPGENDPTDAELMANITPEAYMQALLRQDELRRQKRETKRLERMAEELRQAGYTVIKEEST